MIICIIGFCLIGVTLTILGVNLVINKLWDHYASADDEYWEKKMTHPEQELSKDLISRKKKYDKFRTLSIKWNVCEGQAALPFWIGAILSALFIIVCGTLIITSRAPREVERTYQSIMIEREALVYRLENNEELGVGNELLYKDIVKFNQIINDYQFNRDNPWISWFVDPKLASIEKIEFKQK